MIKVIKRYKHMFNSMDSIMYFNVFLFVTGGILGIKENIAVAILMILLGICNAVFLVLSLRTRHQLHLKLIEEVNKEVIAEEIAQKEGNNDFIRMKQEMLENRLYAYIKNDFPNAKFIKNAYIPKQDDTFSEIDLLMVDKSGIYIVEAKNYAGTITGNWKDDDRLMIKHPSGTSYDFFNPIKQNTNHYRNLKNATGLDGRYFRSLIVLGDHTIFDFKTVPSYARVCQVKNASTQIRYLSKLNPVEISQHDIEQIYDTLQKYVLKTDEKQTAHLNTINAYKNQSLIK
ncbi:MAG: nuclease-related domain-containing protein [Acholeplasma sp.]|nr:nuclease-related domain-containing protein [Acholeplasma sp.]